MLAHDCAQDDAYPGWAPNPSSAIVKLTADTIGRITGGCLQACWVFAGVCTCCNRGGAHHEGLFSLSPDMRYTQVLAGKAPEVKAIHAGLECGIIGEKLPGLDCVSYGPTIT